MSLLPRFDPYRRLPATHHMPKPICPRIKNLRSLATLPLGLALLVSLLACAGTSEKRTLSDASSSSSDGGPVVEDASTASTSGEATDASAGDAASGSDNNEWLAQHNRYRTQHCAAPLAWDPGLAREAQQWADRCVFEHAPDNNAGENLFAAAGASQPAVDVWYDEVQAYDFSRPAFSSTTGHFTQVVWRGTTHLGCAEAVCPELFVGFSDTRFVVCRYAPAGNVSGEFPQNVLAAGSSCP